MNKVIDAYYEFMRRCYRKSTFEHDGPLMKKLSTEFLIAMESDAPVPSELLLREAKTVGTSKEDLYSFVATFRRWKRGVLSKPQTAFGTIKLEDGKEYKVFRQT
jgi:hypothetical protein